MVREVDLIMGLQYLKDQSLYHDIKIDLGKVDGLYKDEGGEYREGPSEHQIDHFDLDDVHDPYRAVMVLSLGQQTLLVDEGVVLGVSQAEDNTPMRIAYNDFGDEMTFPQIYLGQPRSINPNVPSSVVTMAMSECSR